MNSDYIQSVLTNAMQAFRSGNIDLVISILNEGLRTEIASADAIFNLGITYAEESRFVEAVTIFRCLQSYKISDIRIAYNLGFIYSIQGEHQLALEAYDLALKIQPNDIGTLINKSAIHNEIKNYDLALETIDCALKINQNYHEAYLNKANALSGLMRFDEAITQYDKALSLNPDYAEAYSNKANALSELKYYDEAITHYDKALSLNPDYAEAYSNKANILNKHKRYDNAVSNYAKALSLNPKIEWISGEMLHAKMQMCNWKKINENIKNLVKQVEAGNRESPPFQLLPITDDPLLHQNCANIFSEAKYPINNSLGLMKKFPQNNKVRIGYYSGDFRNHAVSLLMAELFELHDKSKFEIFAFSFVANDNSPMRVRVGKAFNQFIEVNELTDLEIARLSRQMQIDIAVDLGGYTAGGRMGVFSYRAAPIQSSYLGYLGTTSAKYIDYIFADRDIIPNNLRNYYSEKIAYLPNYQVNDRKRLISEKHFTREELGLPRNGFVFCCFNNNYKILPSTFNSWMRILKAVEGSVIFLYSENQWTEANLKMEAEARGVNSTRLIFGKNIPGPEYLARYRVCDLFLDTSPYNAGTTGSDALWAGLPVLTLIGRSFASRVAASILNAIGLPELVTNTREEYESLAIELAMNPKKYADLKLKLANNRLTTPLFDTPLFAKNIEAAYIKMYERYKADLPPDHIFIE